MSIASTSSARALRPSAHQNAVSELHSERRWIARRNLHLTGELLSLLDLFSAHGIPAVPFKGPVLAAVLLGDVALREFIDLDILVRQRDVGPAKDLLLSRGYRPELLVEAGHEAALLASGYHYPLRRDDGLTVELHWALGPREFPYPLDVDDVWTRLQPVALGGRTVHTLGAEDLLLFLCAHGAKHCWWRRQWVADVAELIGREGGLDWDTVVGRARARGAERMLLLGLWLAYDLFDAPAPEPLVARARGDASVRALADDVRGRLFATNPAPLKPWHAHLFHLRVRERWRDRLRYCTWVALTPTLGDWAWLRLPDALYPLYYVVRPIRLAVKYGARLIRSACGGAACAMFCLCTQPSVHSDW